MDITPRSQVWTAMQSGFGHARDTHWAHWSEWVEVFHSFFGPDPPKGKSSVLLQGKLLPQNLNLAYEVVRLWQSRAPGKGRGGVPVSVEMTSVMVQQLEDPDKDRGWRLKASMAITRLVNAVADSMQKGTTASSVASLIEKTNLDPMLVELRHSSTHNELPTTNILVIALERALVWIKDAYWDRQYEAIVDREMRVHTPVRRLLQDRTRKWKKCSSDQVEKMVDTVFEQILKEQKAHSMTLEDVCEILAPTLWYFWWVWSEDSSLEEAKTDVLVDIVRVSVQRWPHFGYVWLVLVIEASLTLPATMQMNEQIKSDSTSKKSKQSSFSKEESCQKAFLVCIRFLELTYPNELKKWKHCLLNLLARKYCISNKKIIKWMFEQLHVDEDKLFSVESYEGFLQTKDSKKFRREPWQECLHWIPSPIGFLDSPFNRADHELIDQEIEIIEYEQSLRALHTSELKMNIRNFNILRQNQMEEIKTTISISESEISAIQAEIELF